MMCIRINQVIAIGLALIAWLCFFGTLANAQTWPHRPVKLVVPLGPGSGADLGARLLADRLTKQWRRTVVVENRPGGDGMVGITAVLGARDDHMLMFGPSSGFVAHPYLHEKLPYAQGDLLPVARFSVTLVGLASPASLNARSRNSWTSRARRRAK
jgi:tripartite-type tricarboxylate transporter receptor subunit TctC